MKRAEVRKAGSVETRPLGTGAFIEAEVKPVTMEKITKKQIKEAAKELGLAYDDEKILFTKRVFAALMKKQ